ncbi:MAG: UxaA family hydrolase [Bacteroidales bacterium]
MKYLRISPDDNVALALSNLIKGDFVNLEGEDIILQSDIPVGHKFAISDIQEGANIFKYGYPIGHAVQAICKGDWVNEDNICTNLTGVVDYKYQPVRIVSKIQHKKLTFNGYRRASGEVGIRNEIWVVPTVGCVNGTAKTLADRLRHEIQLKDVDAIVAHTHNYGCSQLGDDHENTRKILRDIVIHPNAGGVLVVGLGCENNQIKEFRKLLGNVDESRIKFMETQVVDDEYEIGMQLLREIYKTVSKDKREATPLSELKVGLKCGGSDGFSGITANPMLGEFSDFINAQGATTVLTEVPEMFGAETILMDRCVNKLVFDKTVKLINDFKNYYIENKQSVYENPSPGNKAGGISTLEEKSLGCTQKCGKSLVQDVLSYGERLKSNGLTLLSAPGNDLVASTALAASGCQMVLFTTGRGTPFGTFVPTVKVSTNSQLYNKKTNWIDFNAGTIIEGECIENVNKKFIEYIIQIASGQYVNNEKKDYREIAIFKTGVTL